MAGTRKRPVSIKSAARRALSEDKKLRQAYAKAQEVSSSVTLDAKAQSTLDSFVNFAQKLGVGAYNALSTAGYGFNPITRIRTLLEWIHRGSWIGGIAIDVVADDMTRAGVELLGELPPDDIEEINEEIVRLGVWGAINDTIKWSRLYGGSLAVMIVDGQDFSTPLRLNTISRGQFRGLMVLDRWMVEPSLHDLVLEGGSNQGLPRYYRVTANVPHLPNAKIHYSRCLRLEGIRLPYWQRIQENLWGISILERLHDRMLAFDSATTGAAQLVYKSYIRTYKIEGMKQIVAAGGKPLSGLVNYVEMMRRFQGIEGITLMDAKDAMEAMQHGAFSGLAEVILQFGQQLSGATQIPLVRMFGQSPAGLSSTGESDMRMYYDGISQQQNRHLLVPVTNIYRATATSLGKPIPKGFAIGFKPLWQLSDLEKSDIAFKDEATISAAEEGGLIDKQTAMKELRQTSRIHGRFSNITEEDIEAAAAEMPPSSSELAPSNELVSGGEREAFAGPAAPVHGSREEDELSTTLSPNPLQGQILNLRAEISRLEREEKAMREKGKVGPADDVRRRVSSLQRGLRAAEAAFSRQYQSRRDKARDSIRLIGELKRIHDLDAVVENTKGSMRRGISSDDDRPFESVMPADYGYIRKTTGADGDQVDAWFGPNPEMPFVWIIDQINLGTGKFDEHKCMIGFDSMVDAMATYVAGYTDGRGADRVGAIRKYSMDEFKTWLKGQQ